MNQHDALFWQGTPESYDQHMRDMRGVFGTAPMTLGEQLARLQENRPVTRAELQALEQRIAALENPRGGAAPLDTTESSAARAGGAVATCIAPTPGRDWYDEAVC